MRDRKGDGYAQVHHRSRNHGGQQLPVGEHAGLRKIEAFRVFPRTAHQVVEDLHRDIGEHQARQDFIDVEPSLQKRRDGGPGSPARDAGQDHHWQDPSALHVPGRQRHAGAGQTAHHVLSLGTYVPDVGTEPDGKPGADQDEGGGLDAEVLPLVAVEQRTEEDACHCVDAVVPDQGEDERAGYHGGGNGNHGCCPGHRLAGLLAPFKPDEHAPPPLPGLPALRWRLGLREYRPSAARFHLPTRLQRQACAIAGPR
jgi:hypothetical protein